MALELLAAVGAVCAMSAGLLLLLLLALLMLTLAAAIDGAARAWRAIVLRWRALGRRLG